MKCPGGGWKNNGWGPGWSWGSSMCRPLGLLPPICGGDEKSHAQYGWTIRVHDKQTLRHLPNIHKETQHNSTTPEEDFFSEKNQLPQVGLEPTTLCSLDECSTN